VELGAVFAEGTRRANLVSWTAGRGLAGLDIEAHADISKGRLDISGAKTNA